MSSFFQSQIVKHFGYVCLFIETDPLERLFIELIIIFTDNRIILIKATKHGTLSLDYLKANLI